MKKNIFYLVIFILIAGCKCTTLVQGNRETFIEKPKRELPELIITDANSLKPEFYQEMIDLFNPDTIKLCSCDKDIQLWTLPD